MNKHKITNAVMLVGGFFAGSYVQAAVTKVKLRKAVAKAYANCETAQDISDTDNVFIRMAGK